MNPKKPVAPKNPADSKETANPTTPKDDLAETKRKVKDQLEQLVGLDNQTKDALMKQIDAANSNEEIYAILNQARKALPNTGVASSHLLEAFGMLMLSLGLFMPFRRKKNGK
ncbi:LPXTG cell wall anchor domain-containing protein [Weissella viridescens]|uniref:LPXTG cell wall anchor domain-containing protein n=1 Tax=Weissella viridescens TaxID=1629 RepID=UPI0035272D34